MEQDSETGRLFRRAVEKAQEGIAAKPLKKGVGNYQEAGKAATGEWAAGELIGTAAVRRGRVRRAGKAHILGPNRK